MQCILFNNDNKKQKKNKKKHRFNNFVTLHNIQHTSGNRPLKGPALGSAHKYTTLLPLAWPIKPVFHLQIFSYETTFC